MEPSILGTNEIAGRSASSSKSVSKRLTAAEAERALYIDFEGQTDKAPVLLGILGRRGKGDEPSVFQLVVDPEFEAAGPDLRGLRDAVDVLVLRAERRDRRAGSR